MELFFGFWFFAVVRSGYGFFHFDYFSFEVGDCVVVFRPVGLFIFSLLLSLSVWIVFHSFGAVYCFGSRIECSWFCALRAVWACFCRWGWFLVDFLLMGGCLV